MSVAILTHKDLAQELFDASRDVLRESDRCGIVRTARGRYAVCPPLLIDHWIAVADDESAFLGTIDRNSQVEDIANLLEDE